ncbi:hypothetical protein METBISCDRAFT_16679 [Metschnikowia bicuspidata]|uniref:UBR-type domain-containing protein n=1 Tax=Metschnikowia bicuspidata TaxID=27322 RepID=A0A4P9ZD47_9ASCO|nr:hypothetical protein METBISCDRAFT_16679 [Metschnikowia bicuspidata]
MGSLTALDFLENQLRLEKEAREIMPYEPDVCTYPRVLRQNMYACLTCCIENGGPVGVCYLCLIQCHSTHDMVELFAKRNVVCDCGTTRMRCGAACSLRQAKVSPPAPRMRTGSGSGASSLFPAAPKRPADDIPSLNNTYNHNYLGRFCSCAHVYNADAETRTMHQCFFGEACGEDWYHQDCILGFETTETPMNDKAATKEPNETSDPPNQPVADDDPEEAEPAPVPLFPDMDGFSEFICWKCVALYRDAFEELAKHPEIVFVTRNFFPGLTSTHHGKCQEEALEVGPAPKKPCPAGKSQFSVFLRENFRKHLAKLFSALPIDSPLNHLLLNTRYLFEDDPVHEPEAQHALLPDRSLFELGATALLALPTPHAIRGLEAYDAMKKKLSSFFKNFVDQNKVVTEQEVKDFFSKMQQERNG